MTETPPPVSSFVSTYTRWAMAFDETLSKNPHDADALRKAAHCWQHAGAHGKALDRYNRLVERFPRNANLLRARAHLLARTKDLSVRDPTAALRDATRALEMVRAQNGLHSDWVHHQYLGTLAAAHESLGDLDAAIATLREEAPYANTHTAQRRLAAAIERLVKLKGRQEGPPLAVTGHTSVQT